MVLSVTLSSLAVLIFYQPRTCALRLTLLFGDGSSESAVLFRWWAFLVSRFSSMVQKRVNRAVVDPVQLAATWDLLAACLLAGLPVSAAIRAVAVGAPPASAQALHATADLLALGADPITAWAPSLAEESTAPLARSARRTARSGAALASAATALADQTRTNAMDMIEAKAQRAGVLITGPLGLCFLPAFFCLGVIPVIIGLAGKLLTHW